MCAPPFLASGRFVFQFTLFRFGFFLRQCSPLDCWCATRLAVMRPSWVCNIGCIFCCVRMPSSPTTTARTMFGDCIDSNVCRWRCHRVHVSVVNFGRVFCIERVMLTKVAPYWATFLCVLRLVSPSDRYDGLSMLCCRALADAHITHQQNCILNWSCQTT